MAAALAALLAAAGTARAVSFAERDTAKTAVGEAQERLAGAETLRGKAVTLLPVHGDEEGYLSELLLHAIVQSGLTAVIPNDERDARFRRILKEIRWDEEQTRLETVDPATIDELGHLLSTQVLLEGRLMKSRLPVAVDRKGRPIGWAGADGAGAVEMELHLFAYEIRTKRYVWSAVVTAKEEAPKPIEGGEAAEAEPSFRWSFEEAAVPLNVGIRMDADEGAEAEADLVETYARGRLADEGYRVASGKDDDLTLTLGTTCEEFDRTGNYRVYEGTLTARLEARGGEARELGSASFSARGARGLGEVQAHRNLADDMEAQLAGWLRRTLNPEAIGIAAVRLDLALAGPIELAEDFKTIEAIQKGLTELEGVRSARVVGQDNQAGTLEYLVVYEPARTPTGVWNALFSAHPELLDQLR
jgi:hypothetical protein